MRTCGDSGPAQLLQDLGGFGQKGSLQHIAFVESGVIVLPSGKAGRYIEHLRPFIVEFNKAQELVAVDIDAKLPERMIEYRYAGLVRCRAEPLELLPQLELSEDAPARL